MNLVSLPLIFFLYRYEAAIYYILSDQASDILNAININPDIYGYKSLEIIVNSNLQIGGIFFAIAFLIIARKLSKRSQLKETLMIFVIGMICLFGSKALGSLFSAFPPTGLISISFMSISSYLLYLGIYNTAILTARDNKLRKELRGRIEIDINLIKNIALLKKKLKLKKR